jgi:hypothetical protein
MESPAVLLWLARPGAWLLGVFLLAACGSTDTQMSAGALYCGAQDGLEVYVDGQSSRDANGGVVPAMTCTRARWNVEEAAAAGVHAGFWGANQQWAGFRLEFVNSADLTAQGSPGLDGLTDGDTITVTYQDDAMPAHATSVWAPSTVILVHELTHATYGEEDHCNWSIRYAPAMVWEYAWASGFHDDCQNVTCSGDECS